MVGGIPVIQTVIQGIFGGGNFWSCLLVSRESVSDECSVRDCRTPQSRDRSPPGRARSPGSVRVEAAGDFLGVEDHPLLLSKWLKGGPHDHV